MLNKALAAVEDANDSLAGVLKNNIDFNAVKGKTKIPDQKWKDLLDHFNQPNFVLVNDNFEFPDLLGAAYEYLIKYFADSAGKKRGEFYTPAEVVRLLVQLVKPRAPMKKMINILSYFRAHVVEFVFGVRNSGQKETKAGARH
jgi:type I restriction enzyme M protein